MRQEDTPFLCVFRFWFLDGGDWGLVSHRQRIVRANGTRHTNGLFKPQGTVHSQDSSEEAPGSERSPDSGFQGSPVVSPNGCPGPLHCHPPLHCWPGAKKDLPSAELKWADFLQTGRTPGCFMELLRTIPAPQPCPVSVCQHLSFLGQMPQSVSGSPARSRLSTFQKPLCSPDQALARGTPSRGSSLKTPTPQPRTEDAFPVTSSYDITSV